jgi:hypothetical protein
MLSRLLSALENTENISGGFQILTLRKPADLPEAGPKSVSAEGRGSNPLVERIAAAMLRRYNRAPTRAID